MSQLHSLKGNLSENRYNMQFNFEHLLKLNLLIHLKQIEHKRSNSTSQGIFLENFGHFNNLDSLDNHAIRQNDIYPFYALRNL